MLHCIYRLYNLPSSTECHVTIGVDGDGEGELGDGELEQQSSEQTEQVRSSISSVYGVLGTGYCDFDCDCDYDCGSGSGNVTFLLLHLPSFSPPSSSSVAMAHPRRYAVDPSLQASTPPPPPSQQYQQYQQYDGATTHQATVPAAFDPAYQPTQPRQERSYHSDLPPPPPPPPPHTFQSASNVNPAAYTAPSPPQNHIPQPPHSSGPSLRGPKPRIDASQVPSPISSRRTRSESL